MNGLIKVFKQLNAGKYSVLLLDSKIPSSRFSKLVIAGKAYKPVIVYDLPDSIAIAAEGEFEGKEVEFI